MINSFTGKYFFLSNFYKRPVTINGLTFESAEAAFQAHKCIEFGKAQKFCKLDPKAAKALGRRIPLRPDWEYIKEGVMYAILLEKFTDARLRKWLISTKDHKLIEGNTWNDRYWGVCKGKGRTVLVSCWKLSVGR